MLLGPNLTINKSTNKLFNPIFCHCLHWKGFKRKRWGRCLSKGFLTHQFYQSMTLLWSRSTTFGYFYQHLFVNRALTFLSRQTIRVNGSCTIKDEDLRILNFLGIIEPPFWNTGIWKWKHIYKCYTSSVITNLYKLIFSKTSWIRNQTLHRTFRQF